MGVRLLLVLRQARPGRRVSLPASRGGDPRWFGQNLDEGYRFDHLFVSQDTRVESCDYDEEPWEKGLSDRPALIAALNDDERDALDLDADRTLDEPCLP